MEKLELDKEKVIKAYNEGCSDVKKVLENMFDKETFQQTFYKAGQIFLNKITNQRYLLAQVDSGVINLICIDDGNRLTRQSKVSSAYKVSVKEMKQLLENTYLSIKDLELIDN